VTRLAPVPVDRQVFAEIMASFPSGVAVVTTLQNGDARGLTTTAVSSVSAEPPLLLVCVDLTSRTLPAMLERGAFVVNFLRSGRDALARRFASKAEDKFGGIAWRPSPAGLPILHDDAVAWAECSTEERIGAGDHVILLGRVDAGETLHPTDMPLMYYRRTWGEWTPRHGS
jgi:flavin reductase (DIM6/NTAB) family NADH-FMN oxidoreductase RutF